MGEKEEVLKAKDEVCESIVNSLELEKRCCESDLVCLQLRREKPLTQRELAILEYLRKDPHVLDNKLCNYGAKNEEETAEELNIREDHVAEAVEKLYELSGTVNLFVIF